MITVCGCVVVPAAVIGLGDGTEVQCLKHGWQKIARRATFSEIAGLPEQPPLPEFPPF